MYNDIDKALFGSDLFGNAASPMKSGELSRRFEFPPFSVLNAREGAWQERKRAWISLGLRGECGREAAPGSSMMPAANYSERQRGNGSGQAIEESDNQSGTSIFDPVLCELAYRWFCPPSGQIIDPFAGGSVRGIVAGLLGFRYWGCDLRSEQIEANESQREKIASGLPIEWRCGDAIEEVPTAPEADFLFSCPPYGDLERYSDDPKDLSTMEYHTFIAEYKRIILRSFQRLKNNRFACFVVGDFRDERTGNYRGFVADTINAFRDVGMPLYNDAVLVTSVGSLPIRVSGQFDGSRKLGKTHQNVLVFAKGDPRKAFR